MSYEADLKEDMKSEAMYKESSPFLKFLELFHSIEYIFKASAINKDFRDLDVSLQKISIF